MMLLHLRRLSRFNFGLFLFVRLAIAKILIRLLIYLRFHFMHVNLWPIQIASVLGIVNIILFEDMKAVNRLVLILRIVIKVGVAIEIGIYMRDRIDYLNILFN
jgi:hypothetical protein